MKKYRKKIILLIVIILILSIPAWYLTPIKKNISTSLCSLDGDRIDVTLMSTGVGILQGQLNYGEP